MKINPKNYTILIVDDVLSNVLLLKVLLTNEKYNIEIANNGQEALNIVKNNKPDLVLLDVMMPGMNGFEVAEKLRSDSETTDMPIIFLTALNSTEDIVKGFKIGGNDFITKPFNKEELLIRVKHQISLIAANRIIYQHKEELKKTIKGRDKLYSVIAHDMRSPIGSVKMVLNMLMLNLPQEKIGEEMFELLNSANQTIEDVFSLLDNLLKWTKSQTGRLKVVKQLVNIVEVIAGVIEIYAVAGELKNIKVNFSNYPTEVMAKVDTDMLKTIVRNLVNNAIKFSNANSEINVAVKTEEHQAVVSVQDFGCGMSEEQQSNLLHTDTHFSTFGTNNEEGSGLGLLLCKDFIERNDGKLWFESTKNVGTTFYFSVPLDS